MHKYCQSSTFTNTHYDMSKEMMCGCIIKKVDKIKFFQKTVYPKRYMIVDFARAEIYIKHDQKDRNDDKETK